MKVPHSSKYKTVLASAFELGVTAAASGEALSIRGNPYPFESDEYFDWQNGWWSFFCGQEEEPKP